jgi:hypothetical protein
MQDALSDGESDAQKSQIVTADVLKRIGKTHAPAWILEPIFRKAREMGAYLLLVPVTLAVNRTIVRQIAPALIFGPGRRRRAQQQQASAARAGRAVNLSRAFPRSVHRELVERMRDVEVDERRRLAAELATYTAAGPVRVHAVVVVPGQEQCLKLEFSDGWQLTVSGMAAASARQLLDAARAGMRVTGVEVVEGLAFRLRVRWSVSTRDGQTSVKLAALRGPSSSEQMRAE